MIILKDCEHLALIFSDSQLQYLVDLVHKDLVNKNAENTYNPQIPEIEDVLDHFQIALQIAQEEE